MESKRFGSDCDEKNGKVLESDVMREIKEMVRTDG